MTKPALTLYTAKPTDWGYRALASYIRLEQPVELKPLSELPPPDRHRKQRLRAELVGWRALREATLELIVLAENYPARFGHELPGLRRERDTCELTIEDLEKQLHQKGGPSDG